MDVEDKYYDPSHRPSPTLESNDVKNPSFTNYIVVILVIFVLSWFGQS